MVTLWNKYPEIPNGSIGWRMGYGEDYAIEFYRWFKSMDHKGQTNFIAQNPEPEEWFGYYDLVKADSW